MTSKGIRSYEEKERRLVRRNNKKKYRLTPREIKTRIKNTDPDDLDWLNFEDDLLK